MFGALQAVNSLGIRRAGPYCGFPGILYNVGDFSTKSLFDIWHGSEIKKVREMVNQKEWQLPCLQCQGARLMV